MMSENNNNNKKREIIDSVFFWLQLSFSSKNSEKVQKTIKQIRIF